MDQTCDLFEAFLKKSRRGCSEGERRDFEEHLVNCPACRDQRISEKALGNLFSETTPPGLSPAFNEKLRRRINEEREKRSLRPFVMQAYWLAVCLISVLIVLNRSGKNMEGGAAVVLLLLCFAAPTLLLGRMFGFNLFDLILDTMNRSGKRIESFRNGHGAG
jgi:predicted anti-sigma-YlaC factor YlaD